MPRPKRPRHIYAKPSVRGFMPDTGETGDPIMLTHEEFESIRLIDYKNMDQSQAAEQMGVSRQTVGRILKAARSKISQAIVEGCSLKIRGGCYRMQNRQGVRGKGCQRGRGRGMGRGMGRGSGRLD